MVEKLFILGGNPRRGKRAKARRRPSSLKFRTARRNPAPGAGDAIPAFLKSGMKPIRDAQARRRASKRVRAGSPEALAWGRKMKRLRNRKLHPAIKRVKRARRSTVKKSRKQGVRKTARKRKGGMKKGSTAAKRWGRKMKALRAAKHTRKSPKRHYKKHGKKTARRHYRRHTQKVRRIMVPARYGKHYRKSGWKRIKVLSNPGGKLFGWLKFGGLVVGGFVLATAVNKLFNKYVMPSKPQSALVTGLGLSVLAILFGKKIWKQMPESILTGIVANTMISAVSQFAPGWLEWVLPEGSAAAMLTTDTVFTEANPTAAIGTGKYIPNSQSLMDYGNPYGSFGGDENPLMASPYAGANY